jgi:hypothetical protein
MKKFVSKPKEGYSRDTLEKELGFGLLERDE